MAFDAYEYQNGRSWRKFRGLMYKIEGGKVILEGVKSDCWGPVVPKRGTGSIRGDVAKFVTAGLRLDTHPGRSLDIDMSAKVVCK